jgi:hypothetical protein
MNGFVERANARAVGWRWQADGLHHELTWLRGTTSLILATSVDGTNWRAAMVENPLLPSAPTLAQARAEALRLMATDGTN